MKGIDLNKMNPNPKREKKRLETIGGLMKYFRMSYDEIVYERSWANVMMLSASIPDYSIDNEDDSLSPAEKIAKQLKDSEPKLTPMAQILGIKR